MGIRERARQILSIVPPLGGQINSTGSTAQLFTKLAGATQATLEANWASGGIMTCCNGFTGWFSRELGSSLYLGRFDLDTFLPKNGKGDAWIKSEAGKRPKYGDICRYAKFHVGVSEDFEGETWNHVDGGQGGKRMGFDVIKRIRDANAYEHTKLLGWVDIEIFFGETSASEVAVEEAKAESAGPVPDWLLGWWDVKWRGQDFYYYFNRDYKVTWCQVVPLDKSRPASVFNDTGAVAIDSPGNFTITWGASGSVEKFQKSMGNIPMRGMWNDKETLTAIRM